MRLGLFGLLLTGCLISSTGADQVAATWASATTGTWTNAAMWSTNPVAPENGNPVGKTYTATIDAIGGFYDVYATSPINVDRLTIDSPSATLYADGINAASVQINRGALNLAGFGAISGDLQVNSSMYWSAGTLASTGQATIGSGAYLNIQGGNSGFSTRVLSRTLTNAGTITFAQDGSLTLSSGTLINNHVMLFNQGSNGFGTPIGNSVFLNNGIVQINAPSSFGNSFRLSFSSTPFFTNVGTILINSGTWLHGSGSIHFSGGSRVTGPGVFQISSSAVLNATGAATLGSAVTQLSAGTITGGGEISLPNTMNWDGGVLEAGGTFTALSGSAINVGTAGAGRTLSRALVNNGIMSFLPGGTISLNNGTLINNNLISFNGGSSGFSSAGSSLFQNNGTIQVNASTFTNSIPFRLSISSIMPFVNNGTIILNAATFGQDGGTHTYNSGSRFMGSGVLQLTSSAVMNVTGAATFGSAVTLLSGGTITGAGEISMPTILNWDGGTLAPGGTLTAMSGSMINVGTVSGFRALSRALVNNGTMMFNSGSITLNSGTLINNHVIQFGNGSTAFSSSGSSLFQNNGTMNINALVNQSAFRLSSFTGLSFVNTGTININTGTFVHDSGTFTHQSGTRFLGAGALVIGGSAVMNVTGSATLGNAFTQLSGGQIIGPGEISALNVVNFDGGTLAAGGTFTLQTSAVLNVGTAGVRSVQRPLVNLGVMNIAQNSTITLNSGTLINQNLMSLLVGTFTGNSAVISSGTSLFQNNGTILVNGVSIGTGVRLAGGSPSGSASFVNNGTIVLNPMVMMLHDSGTYVFNFGSRMTGPGVFQLNGTATLNVTGVTTFGASRTLLNGGTITGAGEIAIPTMLTWTGGTLGSGGTITVLSGALLNTGTGSLRMLSRPLVNDGTMFLSAMAPIYLSNGTLINNHVLNVATLSGIGGLPGLIRNNGTLNIQGSASLGSNTTIFAAGAVNLTGSLSLFGETQWSGGSISGAGTLLLYPSGSLTIIGARTLSSNLYNRGTTSFAANSSLTLNGGTFTNAPEGNLILSANPNLVSAGAGGSLNNQGMISAPSGTINLTVPLSNTGTISVGGGAPGAVLTVSSVDQLAGGTLNAGTFRVVNDAVLNLPGTFATNNGGVVLDGAAATLPAVASLHTNGGTFAVLNGASFTTIGNLTHTGLLNIGASSTMTINGDLIGGGNIQLDGALIVPGAMNVGNIDGSATLDVPAGKTITALRVRLPKLDASGTLLLTATGGGAGVSSIDDLNFLLPGAKLDIARNDLILKTGVSGTGTLDDIKAMALSGTNLFSSTAAGDGKQIAYLAAAALGGATDWKGVPITAESVILSYVDSGDANLDGRVNTVDFNVLAGNFGQSGMDWFTGDFDNDGTVDSDDFAILAGSYGKGATAAPTLGAVVPEPAAISLIAFGATAFRRRRAP